MTGPGALIADRYRLVRQLGAGGMGVVWQALDERLDRPVAVKQLRTQPGLTAAETDLAARRAIREARINARLHHPHAVSVYDVVEHQGSPCIVMELVPSVPLTEAMHGLGALTASEAARVGSQVAAALATAHDLGIVHRDVKPGNVLIGDDGAARICDFGISRTFGDTTLTMTGMLTGTPAYLAPEVARGEASTFASDVYSLGATLYAAVEGEPPFGSDGNVIAVLYRVTAGDARPPERSGALGPLLMAMMSAEPKDRPSMAQAAALLSTLADGRTLRPGHEAGDRIPPMPPVRPNAPSADAPTSALPPADTPTALAQRPPDPAPAAPPQAAAPSAQAAAPPAAQKRRRPGLLVAAIVVLILLAGTAAIAWLLPNLERPTTGPGPNPAVTRPGVTESAPSEPTTTEPSSNRSNQTPTPVPTTAQLAQAVTDYYALLPDDTNAGWELLTPAYQRRTGGRNSYQKFWKTSTR
ncbi:hypothetical protein GCM10022236_27490 [Microlunatus ginsengisoli]|uniref:non-specific serine/threonine protein kinase n=2 Tax=Microlunatus ginsengisoli TaxID=363863 RepID=A0ABP7A2F7_9ACTN